MYNGKALLRMQTKELEAKKTAIYQPLTEMLKAAQERRAKEAEAAKAYRKTFEYMVERELLELDPNMPVYYDALGEYYHFRISCPKVNLATVSTMKLRDARGKYKRCPVCPSPLAK